MILWEDLTPMWGIDKSALDFICICANANIGLKHKYHKDTWYEFRDKYLIFNMTKFDCFWDD